MLPKIMILSDIHGGYYNLDRALAYYEKEKFERLFVLGDLFGYSFDETDDEILKRIRPVHRVIVECDHAFVRVLHHDVHVFVVRTQGPLPDKQFHISVFYSVGQIPGHLIKIFGIYAYA